MSPAERGLQLHCKAALGEKLSDEEQEFLRGWYAGNDSEESAILTGAPLQPSSDWQGRTDLVLRQLQSVTQQIQSLTAENASLRREIALLESEFAQRPYIQSI